MNLHDELGAQRQAITEKTPRHVFPTIEAATERLKDAGEQTALPAESTGRPALNDLLLRLRLEAIPSASNLRTEKDQGFTQGQA